MVTLVVDGPSVTEEQIQAYIKANNIEGEYEIISKEEYDKRMAREQIIMPFEPMPHYDYADAEFEERERKERKFIKDQQKYARKFYGKRK